MAAKNAIVQFHWINTWLQDKRNVLFIAEPQDDAFVLFPQASEPSMNFHILKLVYCKLDFKFQSSDVIESAVSYFTLFCSKISLWSQPEVARNFLSPLNKAFTL